MYQNKYDVRGSNREGKFGEKIYAITREYKVEKTGIREDCAGVDFTENEKKIDVKGRKSRKPAHTAWMELGKATDLLRHQFCLAKNIGTGWSYKENYTAQMMVYEKNKQIISAIFGEYYNPDALENLIKKKVDLDSEVSVQTLYKVYSRFSKDFKDGKIKHRGDLTLVTYDDLENLKTFKKIEIPEEYWPYIMDFYKYEGILT